jgi:hypothetical protein
MWSWPRKNQQAYWGHFWAVFTIAQSAIMILTAFLTAASSHFVVPSGSYLFPSRNDKFKNGWDYPTDGKLISSHQFASSCKKYWSVCPTDEQHEHCSPFQLDSWWSYFGCYHVPKHLREPTMTLNYLLPCFWKLDGCIQSSYFPFLFANWPFHLATIFYRPKTVCRLCRIDWDHCVVTIVVK